MKKILLDTQKIADAEGDYKNQINGIRILDKVCEDEEDAREFIDINDKKFYDNLAVRYYEYPKNIVKTKRHESLEDKLSTLTDKLTAIQNTKYTPR